MRYSQIIKEGVNLSSLVEFGAFAVAVAEAYDAAPVHDPGVDHLWQKTMSHLIHVLAPKVFSKVNIEFTKDDPYQEIGADPQLMFRMMLFDILFNKRLLIWSGESEHPLWNSYYQSEDGRTFHMNSVFRAVHDALTHGSFLRQFKDNLLQVAPNILKGERPSNEELRNILTKVSVTKGGARLNLTARGELNASSVHMRLAPPDCAACIFTEVSAQTMSVIVLGKNPIQKVAILEGFDFQRIGKTIPGSRADERKKEVIDLLNNSDDQFMLPLQLKDKPAIKKRILLNNVRSRDRYS